jgi:hypothetical protein
MLSFSVGISVIWRKGREKNMKLFERLLKPKNEDRAVAMPEYDYSVLPEMARILTNGSTDAVGEMEQLAHDAALFLQARRGWAIGMEYEDFGVEPDMRQEETLLIFAYWLCGYQGDDSDGGVDNPEKKFGCYIDWKEETDEIIAQLADLGENLGYSLDLELYKINYDEFTDKALASIAGFLSPKGYALLALDTDGDCYHLFLLKNGDVERLLKLASKVGFKFTTFSLRAIQ